jgi:hypothetical protein
MTTKTIPGTTGMDTARIPTMSTVLVAITEQGRSEECCIKWMGPHQKVITPRNRCNRCQCTPKKHEEITESNPLVERLRNTGRYTNSKLYIWGIKYARMGIG